MRVAVVVQRYGEQVVGGAESLARSVCERLVADLGWQVDVLTTTARDYQSWDGYYPEGWTEMNGVKVGRFASSRGRSRLFWRLDGPLSATILFLQRLRLPRRLLLWLEHRWLLMQGPVNPEIIRYLREHLADYDRFIFFTYLYLPTIDAVRLVGQKSILVPAAHDERPLYFMTVERVLLTAGHLLANSEAELQLLLKRGVPADRVTLAGVGVDMGEPDLATNGEDAVDFAGTSPNGKEGDSPYVLYLGRISNGKKVDTLIDYFDGFLEKSGDMKLRLVLAGRRDEGFVIPEKPWLQYLGFVPEPGKARLIETAACVVNPSALESLSLIVLEAMARRRPVLVNMDSPALAGYVESVPGAYGYRDMESFMKGLSLILERDWQDDESLRVLDESRRWVEQRYSWPRVIEVYGQVVEGMDQLQETATPDDSSSSPTQAGSA